MTDVLDIAEVARRTGLSLRALRFYEARGLVQPLRTAGGRRLYGPGEIARLHATVALKRAGFSLAQVAALLGRRPVDMPALVAVQLEALERRAQEVAESRALLQSVQSRIDRGEPIDVATLCSLIRNGDPMEQQHWKAVSDRYLGEEAKADFTRAAAQLPADFDQAGYSARWEDLGSRIEAALPLAPTSPEALALFAEWQALLAPFSAVATPAMAQDVARMYDGIDSWKGEQKPPFSAAVWAFVKQVAAARGG